MTLGYRVSVYDCAGRYNETSCTDFAHLLSVVALMRRAYPDQVVVAINTERCDGDSDGLTDDEREAVDKAIGEPVVCMCPSRSSPQNGYCPGCGGQRETDSLEFAETCAHSRLPRRCPHCAAAARKEG